MRAVWPSTAASCWRAWPVRWSRSEPGTASTSRTTRPRWRGWWRWSRNRGCASRPRRAATDAATVVEVVPGLAERLPLSDASVDAVVFCMVLCSLPDVAAALAEARRVLKPGGQVRFLEHVRADTPGLARIQRVPDASVWPYLAGGCHTGRDTLAAIEQAGFAVTGLQHFLLPEVRTPFSFHVLGAAVPESERVRGGAG
ncbi:class I SAM-dependent methyltransferase [Nonomuraea rubra]|uniref:class I SAM-dependent methyltransferase n=1 Tax=Nonomuraea rubra TaxID=46180 RepID=UPI0033FCC78C